MQTNQQGFDISKKFEGHQRAAHKLLYCHLCAGTSATTNTTTTSSTKFKGEPAFLDHARKHHPDIAADYPGGLIWKDAIEKAASKA